MMRAMADDDELPKRATRQEQPGRATLGCALVVGVLLPVAASLWAIAVRLTTGRW